MRSDDKKRARLTTMRFVLSRLPYPDKDWDVIGALDGNIIGNRDLIYDNAGLS